MVALVERPGRSGDEPHNVSVPPAQRSREVCGPCVVTAGVPNKHVRGTSSPGRAGALQASGMEFKSPVLHVIPGAAHLPRCDGLGLQKDRSRGSRGSTLNANLYEAKV